MSLANEYYSESTIDNPPKEQEEAKQESLFDEDEHEQNVQNLLDCSLPAGFEFKLTLTLKASGGNPNPTTLPIAFGVAPRDRVEEVLRLQFGSDYFKRRLRAVVGEPITEEQLDLITQEREARLTENAENESI